MATHNLKDVLRIQTMNIDSDNGLLPDSTKPLPEPMLTHYGHSAAGNFIVTVQDTKLILGLCPANERRRYKVTPSLIGWAQT